MKRIGVITQYYNSSNFGGLLQAYALCEYLKSKGYEPKQIVYNQYKEGTDLTKHDRNENRFKVFLIKKSKNALIKINNLLHGVGDLRIRRRDACRDFRESIPHTAKLYDESNISECFNDFDVFITGSDQVWRPSMFCPAFFLSFVDGNVKPKISYAASINSTLADYKIRETYADKFKDFTTISVREKQSAEVVRSLTSVPVYWAIDPVFLLSANQWRGILQKSGIEKPFVFCYFLGDGIKERALAEEYAKKHNLLIVTIPYMQKNYRKCDKAFGDIRLIDVSPPLFLSLIHDSRYVITDSFHASAFSIIFNKPFFAFGREDHPEMSGRIASLASLFECQNRYCCNFQNEDIFSDIESLGNDNIEYGSSEFELLKEESKKLLLF